ncbi:unnamed protein product [Cylindrotheca closterium]|uniref:Uncharacterized protein n=1 Tax=Cylindrotheca closterium TaxID=2856 RepID=A0AAD2FY94_9STRA|nr:unnamed protein product [Cylindrotheca closterium]
MLRRKAHSSRHFNHASLAVIFLLLSIAFTPSSNAHILGQTRRLETVSQRSVEVINKSGRRVDVFWVNTANPKQEEFVSQSENADGVAYGAAASINSYVGHTFEVREMPGKNSGKCLRDPCWKARFTVSTEHEQEVRVKKGFILDHTGSYQRSVKVARTLYEECEEQVNSSEQGSDLDIIEVIDAISACMKEKTDAKLEKQQEEVDFQYKLRAQMAESMAPLACGDVNYTVTDEGKNVSWAYTSRNQDGRRRGETHYKLRVLHERPTSYIASIPGFVAHDECLALQHFEETSQDGSVSFATMDKFRAAPQKYSSSLMHLTDKLTSLLGEYLHWPELDVSTLSEHDDRLFQVHKDPTGGMSVPALLCTAGDLELEKETGVRDCKLPGEGPMLVPTTHFQVDPPQEEGVDSYSKVATAFVFCEDPINKQLGALHFPHAGVHIAPQKGMVVVAIHRKKAETEFDGYVHDYHFCPNHQLYTQSFFEKESVAQES